MLKAYTADNIFTGNEWLAAHVVICEDGRIVDIVTESTVSTDVKVTHFSNKFLAPAFVDLQVYGASGKLFSAEPSHESLYALEAHCYRTGVVACLPTVATNTWDVIFNCIDEIRLFGSGNYNIIQGLHVEGPWISLEKRGAHVGELVKIPTLEDVKELLDYGRDVIKIITLAPEVCDAEILKLIKSYDVKISAGHSNAGFAEAQSKFGQGINLATHLFNAMRPFEHRETGIVGAIFLNENVVASIVPDGYHVDFNAIKIASKVLGERLFAITDAVTDAQVGPYRHSFFEDRYIANGVLSGSALTMLKALNNLVTKAGIELPLALKMCSTIPAVAAGFSNYGFIAPGFSSSMIAVDYNLTDVNLTM